MTHFARLVWLDEADAQNPALVGAKASRLAAARSRGLPVLNGFAVPVDVSFPAIAEGEATLGSRNSGAARTSVYNHEAPPLFSELAGAAQKLGDSLVVRSSSRAESEGIWAGAFASYANLRPEEVALGVVGCWASVFSPDALKRAAVTGMQPGKIGMAVLIQPELQAAYGGVATLGDSGEVLVAGTLGHHAGIVAGWERGHTAVVTEKGAVQPDDTSPLSTGLLSAVATLTRETSEKTGCNHIEWATGESGELFLLQAQPKSDPRRTAAHRQAPDPTSEGEPWLDGVVRMMIRYPGPVGERFVWPWAIGIDHLSPAPGEPTNKTAAILAAEIRESAARLMSQRWGELEPITAEQAWSAFRNSDSSLMHKLISRHPSVDRALATEHLQKLQELAQTLVDGGVIPHADWMWRLDPDAVDQPPTGQESPIRRIGIGPWDPFLYSVIASQGKSISGYPAAGGWGAGRLRLIRNADDAACFAPREVVAAVHPLNNLAPLVWNASGLITAEGSPGAHLFEVADWLGVPAVWGVDVRKWVGDTARRSGQGEDPIVAVDGNLGRVSVLC